MATAMSLGFPTRPMASSEAATLLAASVRVHHGIAHWQWLPIATAAVSFAILVSPHLKVVTGLFSSQRSKDDSAVNAEHATENGKTSYPGSEGTLRRVFNITRFLGTAVLLALSVYDCSLSRHRPFNPFSSLALSVYTLLLAATSVFSSPKAKATASSHVTVVLFSMLVSLFIQYIYPALFIGRSPSIPAPAWLAWTRFALLATMGVIIPLIIPVATDLPQKVPFLFERSHYIR